VRPAGEVFVFFMLKAELTAFVELGHHFFDNRGVALVANVLKQDTMYVVSLKRERLWFRGLRKLLDVVLSEFVLYTGFFQENCVRLYLKTRLSFLAAKEL
jgi:hypothetical protein